MSKERPILFSAPLVRAILAGEKTVTRRALRVQPEAPRCIYDCDGADTVVTTHYRESDRGMVAQFSWAMTRLNQTPAVYSDWSTDQWRCPQGGAGDRLWVREAWRGWFGPKEGDQGDWHDWHETPRAERTQVNNRGLVYRATQDHPNVGRWVTPLFMPRWASRITLAVVSVRVERLHAITADEVLREGVRLACDAGGTVMTRMNGKHPPTSFLRRGEAVTTDALLIAEFASLWSGINGRESWESNPFVWRIEFKRVTP